MEKESRLKDFLANPYKSMWKMALPIIAGMMVQTLFNVVDIMFIGWLGADEVTAVAFVSPLFFIILLASLFDEVILFSDKSSNLSNSSFFSGIMNDRVHANSDGHEVFMHFGGVISLTASDVITLYADRIYNAAMDAALKDKNFGVQNINELYEFKKTLQDNEIIIPILKESKLSKKSVTFTPINPSDLISLDGLLPPKSTWITPRL